MSNPLPLILISSLVAGGVGAAATTVLMSKPEASAAGPEVVDANSELLASLTRIEENQDALAQRIQDLEAGSELAPINTAAPRVAAVAPPEKLEEAVLSVLAKQMDEGVAAATTPALERTVEAVIEMREEREKLERDQKRAAAEEQRMEDRLAKLQSDLGLDQNQVDSMRKIYQDQQVKRDEMRTEMRALRDSGGGSREDMRAMWTEMNDTTNTAIQGVLSPTQYEQYQESNGDNGRGGRGGRGGGGNDGGGGGGRGGGRGGN